MCVVTLLKYVYRNYEILSEGNVIEVQYKVNIESHILRCQIFSLYSII